MMKNSPYLDQNRDLEVLLRLVRDYDATTRQFRKLPEVPRGGALLSKSRTAHAATHTLDVAEVHKGKSSLKRAS